MIATCPSCATRYVLDPAALGRQGRMVRCAKCRNTWHLTPPEEALAEAEEAERPPRYIPGMDIAGQPAGEEPAESVGPLRAARRNLPAVRETNSRQMLIAWGALAASLVIFLAILIGLRGPIRESIPFMGSFYDAVGLGEARPVTPVRQQTSATDVLTFTSLGLKLESEGGVPVLTVTGQISNGTDENFVLPTIKATLLDGNKDELYSWNFEPPAPQIGPEQSLAFSSRLSNPPSQVREAVLTFASDSDGEGG